MHKVYEPIVRIGPNEVHVADPHFYYVLYRPSSERRHKDHFALDGFGLPDAVLETGNHDLHRMRRAALNPYFSTQAIAWMEPVVHEKLELLCDKLTELEDTQEAVNVEAAIMSMTTDIITQYCFGNSYDFLKKPHFSPEWARMIMSAAEMSNLGRYFPWLPIVMAKMPPTMVRFIDSSMVPLVVFTKVRCRTGSNSNISHTFMQDQEKQVQDVKSSVLHAGKGDGQRSIIQELLQSDMPESEKSVKRIAQEAQTLVSAGSTTTVHFLKTTIYFILADLVVHERLKAELKGAFPDPRQNPPLHVLEQLPYLNAVVKEGSRMTHGPSSRLARIAPDQDLKFKEWVLPAGTSISMTHSIQHRNPDIFANPDEFNPERWLDSQQKLDRYLVNFGRGARSCLGINLAKVEMYRTLATLFRRFDFELSKTDRSDVDMAHDFFIPYARVNSDGVRVLVQACKH